MVLICAGVQVQEQNRVPLFSFSKPQYFDPRSGGGPFFDIMYPAWTFWGGGMMPRPRTMRAELIGHFKACVTEIYLHIDARVADYIRKHP